MLLGGSDALGQAAFGKEMGIVLEKDIPALLVEMGKAAGDMGWNTWSAEREEELQQILAKYV